MTAFMMATINSRALQQAQIAVSAAEAGAEPMPVKQAYADQLRKWRSRQDVLYLAGSLAAHEAGRAPQTPLPYQARSRLALLGQFAQAPPTIALGCFRERKKFSRDITAMSSLVPVPTV
jgi:hypothetical protein